MEYRFHLEQVKGNTWVLRGWQYVPLYRLDEGRCVLLDTGLIDQREALEKALTQAGLTCVGVLCSHAHIDHAGSNGYLREKYGTKIAMSLGEAAVLARPMGAHLQHYNLSPGQVAGDYQLRALPCQVDRIILPQEEEIDFCGATFRILHTPGHSVDHICVGTPDDVLYLGDAIMTGRTLFRSKFPYAMVMKDYFDSLRLLRTQKAAAYIVAHEGIYPEILSFVDMEARFFTQRLQEILDLVEVGGVITPEGLTSRICRAYHVNAHNIPDLSYFERASRAYLFYLLDRGHMEAFMEDNVILYRRIHKTVTAEEMGPKREGVPPAGALSLQLLGLGGGAHQ